MKRSAIYWPERINKKSPILLMHGSADWRVQAHDSIRMAEKLYEQKVPFRLVIFEGATHGLMEVRKEADALTYEWFNRFLKNKEKLPNLKQRGD
jgi:dipeptidyl aminopeptidase/acylaminoacyl peptidase